MVVSIRAVWAGVETGSRKKEQYVQRHGGLQQLGCSRGCVWPRVRAGQRQPRVSPTRLGAGEFGRRPEDTGAPRVEGVEARVGPG